MWWDALDGGSRRRNLEWIHKRTCYVLTIDVWFVSSYTSKLEGFIKLCYLWNVYGYWFFLSNKM
jgi:hypothetical protein